MTVHNIESLPGLLAFPTPQHPHTLRLPMRRTLRRPRRKRARHRRRPVLRFSPTAWAKLLFLRDHGETEVGGFGISAEDDPLYVRDVCLVRQTCTVTSVCFEDAAVADFFDEQVDSGRPIGQVGRIWIHTHPGDCAAPSGTDEETFTRAFGRPDWAVMFILARNGETYCRLRFNIGPGADMVIPTEVDFTRAFASSDFGAWEQEYRAAVRPDLPDWGAGPDVEGYAIADTPGQVGDFEPEDLIWG